jgi:uncharacterized protein
MLQPVRNLITKQKQRTKPALARMLLLLGMGTTFVFGAANQSALADDDTVMVPRSPIRDPQHIFKKNVWSYKELREQNIVMQKQDYSCGAAVLATIMKYYWGDNADEAGMLDIIEKILTPEELADRVKNGLTLEDMRKVAEKAGYETKLGKIKIEDLAESKVPLIVGIVFKKHEHFVVYRGQDGMFVYLADPLRGNVRVPTEVFEEQWQLNAVLAIAKPNQPLRENNPLGLRPGEVSRGYLNEESLRRTALRPHVQRHLLPIAQ